MRHWRRTWIAVSVATLAVAIATPAQAASLSPSPYDPKGSIEQSYGSRGPWAVEVTASSGACDREGHLCDIFLPVSAPGTGEGELQSRPLIVWANGTGQTAANYAYLLEHFASWGFVVVSSRDDWTQNGRTAVDAANYAISQSSLAESVLFGRVDADHVGLAGHSQGGGSTVSLLAQQAEPFTAYVAIHPAPHLFCILVCGFPLSGLSQAEDGAILYLQSAQDGGADDTEMYYDETPGSVNKAFGVLSHAKHSDVMGAPQCTTADCITGAYGYLGYPTAWFAWRLAGDQLAGAAFGSSSGEFMTPSIHWAKNLSNIAQ